MSSDTTTNPLFYDLLIQVKARDGKYEGSTQKLSLKNVSRDELVTLDNIMVAKVIQDFEKSR